jgi:hypothetical protein
MGLVYTSDVHIAKSEKRHQAGVVVKPFAPHASARVALASVKSKDVSRNCTVVIEKDIVDLESQNCCAQLCSENSEIPDCSTCVSNLFVFIYR